MCRIEHLKAVPFQELIEELNNDQGGCFIIKFGEICPQFKTSTNGKWKINEEIVIDVNNKKNSHLDKMIPHKEIRKIFCQFDVREDLVDDLKKNFSNIAFIAIKPQFLTYS